jgi:phosphohistidine phosphatase
MATLYLLRHAKSSWDDSALSDHDRPLAPRGQRATRLLSEHIREAGISPALVLCSSARRARETLEGIEEALGDTEVRIEPELYGASAEDLLARLRRIPGETPSAMLVGHNPGIQAFALGLAGSGHRLDQMIGKYPTGALATLEFQGVWDELAPGAATLAAFVRPKDLS